MTWRSIALGVLVVSLCAALAVDFGFGVAFVNDKVATAISAYVAGLVAFFVGARREDAHWTQRRLIRTPACAVLGGSVLLTFRTVLLFHFPWTEAGTTGHSAYFVLPCASALGPVLLELVYRAQTAVPVSPPGPKVSSAD